MKVYEFVVRDYKKAKAKKVLNEAKTTKNPSSTQSWFQKYDSEILEHDIIE